MSQIAHQIRTDAALIDLKVGQERLLREHEVSELGTETLVITSFGSV